MADAVLPPAPPPTSLTARSWNVYVVLSASPVRVYDVPVPTFSQPPPLTDSWYVVIGLPLSHAGAPRERDAASRRGWRR